MSDGAEPVPEGYAMVQGGHLLGHLLRFGRLLRLMGVQVNLSQMLNLVNALEVVPITDKRDFRHAARTLLVTRRDDLPLFEQAFALYWRLPEPIRDETRRDARDKTTPIRLPGLPVLSFKGNPEEEERPDSLPSYTQAEQLREKNFAAMTWEEVEAAKQAINAMRWQIKPRPTRRTRAARRGTRLDLRRVARDNMRFGGEPLHLRWRQRALRRRPLVVICDISGSMERYTRLLLHFLHALSQDWGMVEGFVFGTRLSRVTHHLRHKDIDASLTEVSKQVVDWAGGTRIGHALREFNFRWARRVLGRGAVALIISDGWDRGEITLLAREMSRLQRASHRLIWLNPLLGSENYQPIQRGMSAALPFVDDFLPVHNLKSLAQLAEVLNAIGSHRPERKQRPTRLPDGPEGALGANP